MTGRQLYIPRIRHGCGEADFSGGNIRLTANYASRKIGEPGVRRGTLIAQAQVKF
jgi:hypothetical protein